MQRPVEKILTPSQQIARALRPWRFRVLSAHAAALILGLVAAMLGIVIGPAMQLLLAPSERMVPWAELIGPAWSSWLNGWLPPEGVSTAELYAVLPFLLVGIATFKSALTFWQWFTWERLGERLAFQWRRDVVGAFVEVDPARRDDGLIANAENNLGGLISQDIRTCRDYVVHFFGGLPREGFQVIFMAISLAILSLKLFAIFVFCIAPVGALLGRLGRKLRRRASHALEDNSVLGEWIQQRLLGLETIKQYRTESIELSEMQHASQNLFDGFLRAARLKARTSPIIEALGVIAMAVALSIAFADIGRGAISGAVAMSFFSTLALFAQSSAKLGRYFNSNREGLAAAERIFGFTRQLSDAKLEDLRAGQHPKIAARSSICLEHVTLRYGDKIAVSDFSFVFQAGKVYCLVGASGAGKSSVFNAMLGLRTVDSGKIDYAIGPGFEDRTLDIAYMPQQVPVIPARLGENVSYPHSSFEASRVRYAMETVHFNIDRERSPAGLDTEIGPGGLQLSGGQLQRLQLARLVYHHAPFVLVDEGTSALDPEMEKVVLTYVRRLAQTGAVVIMIAHRRAAVEASDELIVLADGKLVASGATADVMRMDVFGEIFK